MVINRTFTLAVILTVIIAVGGCNSQSNSFHSQVNPTIPLRAVLAQKLMLDIRYFCQPEQLQRFKSEVSCQTPVTELPEELATMITKEQLGGVILFAENLNDTSQIVTLTHQLQEAAQKSASALPLFIAVDQEGGRVARLPRNESTALSGNMAIGATYNQYGTKYAELSGKVLGAELAATGFNLNFAPSLDVNVNAKNPVINVRSFGEDPNRVSELGLAQLIGMQSQGIIGTLKHFPGHGDTSVDSHIGLPRVEHDLTTIYAVDIAPFHYAIKQNQVHMIMTAHIQYPNLDASIITTKQGDQIIRPATMSRVILTEVLRQEMQYQGLIITDALDMAGISNYFEPLDAVIQTFKAGADIALMPVVIRTPADINKLSLLLDQLELAVQTGQLEQHEIMSSFQRLATLKQEFKLANKSSLPLPVKQTQAEKVLANLHHLKIEQELAEHSVTLVKGRASLDMSVNWLHMLMPDVTKCQALKRSLNAIKASLKVTCSPFYSNNIEHQYNLINKADAFLVANISPQQSPYEMIGLETLKEIAAKDRNVRAQQNEIELLLQHARRNYKQTFFVSMRTPNDIERFAVYADSVFATFSYNAHLKVDQRHGTFATGQTYSALAKALLGRLQPRGQLPVTIQQPDTTIKGVKK